MSVTVIMPTYNRAHLLLQTAPTYLQEQVECLILVDDCSSDATEKVAHSLMAKYPGKVLYLRNEKNRKQTFSKNRGKELADSDFVYFGDDDSVLVDGSIQALLDTQRRLDADIVGAAALYCTANVEVAERYNRYLASETFNSAEDFVDLRRLRFHFDRKPSQPVRLQTLHASMLISRRWYKSIDFDLSYTGNCYREETDYVLQAVQRGAKAYLIGDAVQINLPPLQATGGVRSSSRITYEVYSALNTLRFVRKHRSYFRNELDTWEYMPLLRFAGDRISALLRKAMG
jgi:glycosyltransferase involved in cell wall biosynthesis